MDQFRRMREGIRAAIRRRLLRRLARGRRGVRQRGQGTEALSRATAAPSTRPTSSRPCAAARPATSTRPSPRATSPPPSVIWATSPIGWASPAAWRPVRKPSATTRPSRRDSRGWSRAWKASAWTWTRRRSRSARGWNWTRPPARSAKPALGDASQLEQARRLARGTHRAPYVLPA